MTVSQSNVNQTFDNDLEKFDASAATTLMNSKHTQSKLNALFLDTRQFNMSSQEYIPELSKPGALELYDKTSLDDKESPFRGSNANLIHDFQDIRVM